MRTCLFIGLGILVVGLLVCGGGAFFVYRASQQVPEFYAKAIEVPPAAQRDASDEMVQRAIALASDTEKEGEWHALFTEAQINGWLAVDLVKNHGHLIPSGVSDPRVDLAPEGSTLACRVDRDPWSGVLTLTVDPYLAEPSVLALRIRAARAGALPVPLDRVVEALTAAARQAKLPLNWRQDEGDPVALVPLEAALGKDHKHVRVESLRVSDDDIYFTGHTEK